LTGLDVHNSTDIERKFETFAGETHVGLIIAPNVVTFANSGLIVALAERYRLPAVYPFAFFANGGGLISYGFDAADLFRQGAGYVDKILRGAQPTDLPVQHPTKFEIVVNLKTAKALGLENPRSSRRGDRVRRRDFIAITGGPVAWLLAAPLGVAFAQSNERVRLGYLWIGAEGSDGQTLSGVRQGLADVGLVEGGNLVLERRYADSHPDRVNALAMELVQLGVAAFLTPGAVATRAARSATGTIPIVSVTNDPVALGFAQSLAHPGGNVTGMALTASDQLVEKWVELLKDVTPALKRAALLYDPRPAPMIERVAHVRA
jgi:ABC-type uncharacterized transport system substrate-binding protein